MKAALPSALLRGALLSRSACGSLIIASGLLAGCVDTELGLDATIDAARIEVAGPALTVSLDATYRVGEHAEGARTFQPQAIELYVDGEPVAQLVPMAPPGFQASVAPGESRSATFEAQTSSADDLGRLCAAGVEVTVLFRWLDASGAGTGASEIGMTQAATTDVRCS